MVNQIRQKSKILSNLPKSSQVKGFKDYSGEDSMKRAEIRKILINIFERYGFEPAETPIVEYEDFVKGENSNDEAVSDIFKLQDKGKRKLALRYEFTFQLKRLAKNKKLPYKRYQIGEVFRDEPVSSSRFRQFTQCDIDIIGSTIKDEAEILAITKKILDKLGIDFVININNRKLLNELLEKEKIKKKEQVIRELDKLDKLPEKDIRRNLKKYKAEKILNIFKKPKSYFKKYDAYSEILELEKYCEIYGIKINFQPTLARGLSYYNENIFEIKTKGLKESICGGGSYAVENNPSTGISLGLDRLYELSKIKPEKEKIMVLSINEDKNAIKIAEKLRSQNKSVSLFYGKPSKALEYANSKEINTVIFVGKKELEKGKIKIKDMISGKDKFEKI